MNGETQRAEWIVWLARAVEVFALGAAVLLVVRLWRFSRGLSPAEKIVLFGSAGIGLTYLQKNLPLGNGAHPKPQVMPEDHPLGVHVLYRGGKYSQLSGAVRSQAPRAPR